MDNKIQEFYYKHAYKVMKLQITCPQAHVVKLTSYFLNYSLKEATTLGDYIKVKGQSVTHPRIIWSILVNKNKLI